jgi:hypothetical protein
MTVWTRHIALSAAVAGAILTVAALAVAKTTFAPIAGTAIQIAPPERVETNCIGGAPTGIWPPCTPGSKSQIRGWNLIYRTDFRNPDGTPDPSLTGTRYLVFNASLDENGNGHFWGTFRVVLDAGLGEWEAAYTGFAHGWFGAAEVQAVGHGTQGQVDGMELRAVGSYETWPVDGKGHPGLETDTGYRFSPADK